MSETTETASTETIVEAAKKARRAKRSSSIHHATNSFTIETSTFHLDKLPADQVKHFALTGAKEHLKAADDMHAEWKGLCDGTISAFKPDPEASYIRAAAHAHAEAALKSQGIRLAPKEKLEENPIFQAEMAKFNAVVPKLSKAVRDSFAEDADVLRWHAKLSGKPKLDLAALVGEHSGVKELAAAAE